MDNFIEKVKYYKLVNAFLHKDGMSRTSLTLPEGVNYNYFGDDYNKRTTFWDNPIKILMTFAFARDDFRNTQSYRFTDLMMYGINAHLFSTKFKNFLDHFKISTHTYYEVEVEGGAIKDYPIMVSTGEIRQYHLFHILKQYQHIDFSKSKFGVFHTNGPNKGLAEIFPKGMITDEQHLIKYEKEFLTYHRENPDYFTIYSKKIGKRTRRLKRRIRLYKAAYKEYYDVFTDLQNKDILVNERVKQALELSDLTGWELQEYGKYDTEYQIKMPEME